MTTTTHPRPIAEIDAALSAAAQQVLATAEAHKEAQRVRDELSGELYQARRAADAGLPTARLVKRGKTINTVVIARRTESTIFTRHPGAAPGAERAWRESKYTPGQWNEHPKRKSYWSDAETLQLDEQQ